MQPSQLTVPSCTWDTARAHQLKPSLTQSYHTISTELIWASCPAGVAKREGPSIRHTSSAQMCYL